MPHENAPYNPAYPTRLSRLRLTESQQKGWGRGRGMPPYIWHDGIQHFSIPQLAARRGVSHMAARSWALRRPDYTARWGKHIYCRLDAPSLRPSSVHRDGFEYFSIPELAQRRRITYASAQSFAARHPHLAIRIGWRVYCRDEEWRPLVIPAYILRDGVAYYSIKELARRRGLSRSTVAEWVRRHPHLTIKDGRFPYCRDEEWQPRGAHTRPVLPTNLPPRLRAMLAATRQG